MVSVHQHIIAAVRQLLLCCTSTKLTPQAMVRLSRKLFYSQLLELSSKRWCTGSRGDTSSALPAALHSHGPEPHSHTTHCSPGMVTQVTPHRVCHALSNTLLGPSKEKTELVNWWCDIQLCWPMMQPGRRYNTIKHGIALNVDAVSCHSRVLLPAASISRVPLAGCQSACAGAWPAEAPCVMPLRHWLLTF